MHVCSQTGNPLTRTAVTSPCGPLPAQVRALQLWSLANRNGQFRIYTNSRQETDTLQYSTVALTTGAALVTVLRWLAELRWAWKVCLRLVGVAGG